MPTSGVTTFAIGRDQIIRESLALINAIDEVETPTGAMTANAAFTLNLMIKSWMARGYHLWAIQKSILFLSAATASYSLSSSGARASANVVESALTADATTSATSLSLSTTGMTVGNTIGIVLDDKTMHWTTIATIPSSILLTITTGLPSASASTNKVFQYTSKISRPNRILLAQVTADGIETPIDLVSRQEYFELPEKTSQGQTSLAYYDAQLGSGVLYVWPVPTNDTYRLTLSTDRPFDDFVTGSDSPDFPIEWGMAIVYNLAYMLAPKYGVPLDRLSLIKAQANELLMNANDFDREDVSTFFSPDSRW